MSRAGHARRLSALGPLFGPTAPRTPARKNEDERNRRHDADEEEDPCVDAEKGGPPGRRGPGGWAGGRGTRAGVEEAHIAPAIRGIDHRILVAATGRELVPVPGRDGDLPAGEGRASEGDPASS